MSDAAEERVAAGDPRGALEALQEQVRAHPQDAAARVFLFQLLCVLGEWRRAGTQLDVVAELDPGALLMAQTYRELLRGEVYREAVFKGRHAPLVLGEPPAWLATLTRALPLASAGDGAGAAALAAGAFEAAEARAGRLVVRSSAVGSKQGKSEPGVDLPVGSDVDGDSFVGEPIAFDWLGDADMRLGPVLEAMIDGKYYWVPFERLESLTLEAPGDLRDLVWLPAELVWNGGGKSVGFVPSRYAGTTRVDDPTCLMARRTDWSDLGGGYFTGTGQRLFASSAGDHALLDCRHLVFD